MAYPGERVTDRYNAVIVVLEDDIRDDDAVGLLTAIRQLRGVLSVMPHVANTSDHIAIERVRFELEGKLWKVLHPEPT